MYSDTLVFGLGKAMLEKHFRLLKGMPNPAWTKSRMVMVLLRLVSMTFTSFRLYFSKASEMVKMS